MVRSDAWATSASWVISTMVRPPAWSSSKRPSTSLGGHRIEVAGRFVGQDERRVADQRSGHGHSLLLTTGELPGTMFDSLGQSHPVQRLEGTALAGGTIHTCVDEWELDVAPRGERGQEVELLEDETDPPVADVCQTLFGHGTHILTGQEECPGCRHIQAAEDVHEGRFSRTRGSHHRDVFARHRW